MTAFPRFALTLALGLWCLAGVPWAQAQETDEGELGTFGRVGDFTAAGTSYHVFARPGEATVQVMVLSSGGAGGIYEVGVGTDLGELLALTGGAPLGSENNEVEQEVDLELYRGEGQSRSVIYEASLEEVIQNPGAYPSLRDGDVLLVRVTQRNKFTWRDVIAIVTTVASLLFLFDRIFDFLPGRRR